MANHTFFCVDAHTCGNPVRVVVGGAPSIPAADMIERRAKFMANHDWIRTALMFEPRGHEVMSGSVLYPPTRDDCDLGIVYIEVSGCLPMCGHGTIGTVTVAIERGLVTPRTPGVLRLDTPAGVVEAHYEMVGEHVESVRIVNVPSYLAADGIAVDVAGIGKLSIDIAYGGNFYAIIDPQPGYGDLAELTPGDIQRLSPLVRDAVNATGSFVHPEQPAINRVTHIMWTGKPSKPEAHGRNAVFYGDKAIDRSPCGTGTSARLAQLHGKGKLKAGDTFVHESIIGSLFIGRIDAETTLGGKPAIVPSIAGWARIHGINTIFVDDRDPFRHGFIVK
ncbi:MAG: 4-hydroxyproline epimerase [Proteobacteria bacterium]|nr:4-hydroxyproline epimerase [Pseudomonadota bacterium]